MDDERRRVGLVIRLEAVEVATAAALCLRALIGSRGIVGNEVGSQFGFYEDAAVV